MSVPESEAESIATIQIVVDCDEDNIPAVEEMQRWAETAFLTKPSPVHIRIVDTAEMKKLNGQFVNRHYATNVLSFPMNETVEPEAQHSADSAWQISPEMTDLMGDLATLGDIAICAPVVEAEAREQGKESGAHWAHMIVHGMLHLQGFDHIREEDAPRMEAQEIKILKQLGFSDPYFPSDYIGDQIGDEIGDEIQNMQGTGIND